MGHKLSTCVSRHGNSEEQGVDGADQKTPAKLKMASKGSGNQRPLKQEQFSGIARIQLTSAHMKVKAKWFACVSLGEQTFRTVTSIHTDKPEWKSERTMVLEANGPRIVHVSVFENNQVAKNKLIGFCEQDLSDIFDPEADHTSMVHELFDPSTTTKVVGKITVAYSAEDKIVTEMNFARRLLSVVDYDESGELSFSEFRDLIKAFGNKLPVNRLEDLFKQADENKDGKVSVDELADLLTKNEERTFRVNCCPVCGEKLGNNDLLNDMIHMSLCFDEGTGMQIMTGGFLTDKQASNGWMFKLSEWASFSTYDVGRANAGHILVFDRRTKRLVEELIDNKIVLSMRAIYQSKISLGLLDNGTRNLLLSITRKQGLRMNSPQSKADIPKFIEFFKDRINTDEFKETIEFYKTFNEFFIRELKPGVRPIEHEYNDSVAVSAADSRLMAFNSPDDASRFWIKGRKFSIAGLLGKEVAKEFEGGPMVIFRLAPQDYHRFHVPASGELTKVIDIPGNLYTVNPIAVNSKYCNVFTENKRSVCIINTREFGKIVFVAIGATMVGSITLLKKEGDFVRKGEQFGYFSFGGSTCITVFPQRSIELDDDLLANSERSLETLVSVGMTIGIARGYSYEAMDFTRPGIKDSVAGLNSPVAKQGIQASDSINVRAGHLGVEG